MYFDYRDIDFDVNEKYVTKGQVIDFFDKAIDLSKNVCIYEINVEDNETSYIYLDKQGDINSWDAETINYVKMLQNNSYDVMYADEDYGDAFDVLIIYNNING